MKTILDVNNLIIRFKSQANIVYAVNNPSFKIYENEKLVLSGNQVVAKRSPVDPF